MPSFVLSSSISLAKTRHRSLTRDSRSSFDQKLAPRDRAGPVLHHATYTPRRIAHVLSIYTMKQRHAFWPTDQNFLREPLDVALLLIITRHSYKKNHDFPRRRTYVTEGVLYNSQ